MDKKFVGELPKDSSQKKLAEILQYIKSEESKLGRNLLPVKIALIVSQSKLDLNLIPSLYRELYAVNEAGGKSFIVTCIQNRILQERDLGIIQEIISFVKNDRYAEEIIGAAANQFSSFRRDAKNSEIIDALTKVRIESRYKSFVALSQGQPLPNDISHISNAEYQKISEKFSDYREHFLPLKIFSDYLQSLPEVVLIDKILQKKEVVDYSSIKIEEPLKQNFIQLLQEDLKDEAGRNIAPIDKIIDFFSQIAQQNLHDPEILKEQDQKKLVGFFQENKELLACLFSQENGLEKFCSRIPALSDTGCTANFSAQVYMALYQSLFKNDKDFILYKFVEEIAVAIINSGGDVILGNGNFLNNSEILQTMICTENLVASFKKEFSQQDSLVTNFLRNEIGDENLSIFLELAAQKQLDVEKQKDIMLELFIYKALEPIPKVLENKNLQDYCERCQMVLQEIEMSKRPSAQVLMASAQQVAEDMVSRIMDAAAIA